MSESLPSGWELRALADLTTVDRRSVKPDWVSEGASFVGLEHIDSSGALRPVEVGRGDLKSSKFRFDERHVLYGKLRPYLRKIACPDLSGICSTDILPLLPNDKIDRKYLFYLLRQPQVVKLAELRSSGVNLPRLSARKLGEFRVAVPPLTEQRRIVTILDCARRIWFINHGALGCVDQLVGATLLEMFGSSFATCEWPTKALETVAGIASGVTKGRRLKGRETVSVPYLRVANVQDGFLDLEDVQEIEVLPADVEKYRLEPGDIVLTEGGDPDKLGRGAVWTGPIDPCIHQNHIFRVRLHPDELLPTYFSAYLGSAYGKRYFLRAAKQTTGIASINMTQLRAFPVVVPPLTLQREFAKRVERIKALQARLEAHLSAAEELFGALSQRAFSGNL